MLTRQQLETLDHSALLDYAENANQLSEEIKCLREKLEAFESDFKLVTNANKLLKTRADKMESRVDLLEKELARTAQYGLNRQLELHRIPASVGEGETLKKTVCEALSLTGVQVTEEQLDKCHRLKKNTSVVLEFKQRM